MSCSRAMRGRSTVSSPSRDRRRPWPLLRRHARRRALDRRRDRDAGRLIVSVTDEEAASAGLLPLVVSAGLRLAAFERVRPSLEDVFLRLVGREGAAA